MALSEVCVWWGGIQKVIIQLSCILRAKGKRNVRNPIKILHVTDGANRICKSAGVCHRTAERLNYKPQTKSILPNMVETLSTKLSSEEEEFTSLTPPAGPVRSSDTTRQVGAGPTLFIIDIKSWKLELTRFFSILLVFFSFF